MHLSKKKKTLLIIAGLALVSSTHADVISLGETNLSITATGALNTISGTGGRADSLISVSTDSRIDFFQLVLSDFDPGPEIGANPQSITLEWTELNGTGVVLALTNSRLPIVVGQTYDINRQSNSMVYDVLLGYIHGQIGTAGTMPEFSSTMSWAFGGVGTLATANWTLSAFGTADEPTLIPEPNTIFLLSLALSVLSMRRQILC